MPSPVVSATLQAAMLSGLSNILAQVITAYRAGDFLILDLVPVGQFVLWTLIATPPNFYWQTFLEEKFPSSVVDAKGGQRLSKTNTMKKFVLDQTIGATVNNMAFIAGINTLKGKSATQVQQILHQDFWSLIRSGLKVWPLVSVLSFTVIPANQRILFGSVIGLFWGIYLSMLMAH